MGLLKSTHNLVIMDGSNKVNVFTIVAKIGEIVGKHKTCMVKVSSLDENHPTMVVVEYAAGIMKHSKLKKELDKRYPGLCSYDVAV